MINQCCFDCSHTINIQSKSCPCLSFSRTVNGEASQARGDEVKRWRKNKRGRREKREEGGRSADRTRTVVTCRQWPDGRPVRRVAYATWRPRKQSKKKGESTGERKKNRSQVTASSKQRENEGAGRVNSGEILLVSVKDGPWSALVSWRRRGFSRASPVPTGGGGKWVRGGRG